MSLYGERGKLTGQKFDRPFDMDVETPQGIEGPRTLMSQHFVDCIRRNEKPISDGFSGLVNNRVLDTIYKSASTGKHVEIDWNELEKIRR